MAIRVVSRFIQVVPYKNVKVDFFVDNRRDMKEIIDKLKIEFDNLLQDAGEKFEELKVSFLGKK